MSHPCSDDETAYARTVCSRASALGLRLRREGAFPGPVRFAWHLPDGTVLGCPPVDGTQHALVRACNELVRHWPRIREAA